MFRCILTFIAVGCFFITPSLAADEIVIADFEQEMDERPTVPNRNAVLTREIALGQRYLLFPIRSGAREISIDVQIDGENVREFEAELASNEDDVTFWSFLDVSQFAGKSATLHVKGASEESLALITASDEIPEGDDLYRESMRPQFHFSQRLGWNNDPNGLVYSDGEWHLYFQHNPYGWRWGNMHWGHAVSTDLVHWRQLPIAIYNKQRGDYAFSGGAIVDRNNTAGWQTGDEEVIVASWTSTGRGECIAYSNDRGRTFTEYEGNPVVKHDGRDPKIVWYEPGGHWVMAVYDQSPEFDNAIAFYTSNDLKQWDLASKLKGYYECPELVELPVDGDAGNTRWVVFAADADYAIGTFDGKAFTPEHEGKHKVHFGDYYASQIFSNAPDGRQIQIGWARIEMPDMPFNQTFSFPHELTLRTTEDGIRMFAEPVEEIKALYGKTYSTKDQELTEAKTADLAVSGDSFDIRATIDVGDADVVGLDIGGERITYDVRSGQLADAAMKPIDSKVVIRVLVDRPLFEVVGNDGRVAITLSRERKGDMSVSSIKAFAEGGTATLLHLEVNELESIWNE